MTHTYRTPRGRGLFARLVASALAMTGGMALASAGFADQARAAQDKVAGRVQLKLINGWFGSPYSTNPASAELLNTGVRFRGAIATSGTNVTPFVLPIAYRPTTDVYLPLDLCNGTNGRLYIHTDGTAYVQAESDFSNAQCFTSLDGAFFGKTTTGYKALALLNGWTTQPYSTNVAGVRSSGGIVQFEGAIATSGTNTEPFILPAALRPTVTTYVHVDMCNSTNGRLIIEPTGDVYVEAESDFSNAQCFTSLEGVSFSLTAGKALTLLNGWANSPYGTAAPSVFTDTSGVVHFRGAMSTSGTNSQAFQLPPAYRPIADTYIALDLCNATKGRLYIAKDGTSYVVAETDFSNAQCFTSLDGATFVK